MLQKQIVINFSWFCIKKECSENLFYMQPFYNKEYTHTYIYTCLKDKLNKALFFSLSLCATCVVKNVTNIKFSFISVKKSRRSHVWTNNDRETNGHKDRQSVCVPCYIVAEMEKFQPLHT